MFKKGLSYDDVLLVPQYSDITSRDSGVDLGVDFGNGLCLSLPIFSAPMDTISEYAMACAMACAGGTAVIHRYNTIDEQLNQINYAEAGSGIDFNVGAAIAVTGDFIQRATKIINEGRAKFICVDVAHGHHILVKKALILLRKELGDDVHIMAGNVATLKALNDLSDWGADSVRCGIGGGSICSTRIQTGHGVPGFQTILDCAETDRDVKIIADGGIRNAGDIVKALAAGADGVMAGSLFSGTTQTPGEIFQEPGGVYKTYRGMASKEAQIEWRGHFSSDEGVTTRVPYRGDVFNILRALKKNVKGGLSYSGAKNIKELHAKAEFIIQTPAGSIESQTHILSRKW
jgi:IMP dehydrogenase